MRIWPEDERRLTQGVSAELKLDAQPLDDLQRLPLLRAKTISRRSRLTRHHSARTCPTTSACRPAPEAKCPQCFENCFCRQLTRLSRQCTQFSAASINFLFRGLDRRQQERDAPVRRMSREARSRSMAFRRYRALLIERDWFRAPNITQSHSSHPEDDPQP